MGHTVYDNRFFNKKELTQLGIDGLSSPDNEGSTEILIEGTLYAYYSTLTSHDVYLAYVEYVFSFLLNNPNISFVGYYVDDVELSDDVYVKESTTLNDFKQIGANFLIFYSDNDTNSGKTNAYELLFSFSEEKVTLTKYFSDSFTYNFDFGIRTDKTINIVV